MARARRPKLAEDDEEAWEPVRHGRPPPERYLERLDGEGVVRGKTWHEMPSMRTERKDYTRGPWSGFSGNGACCLSMAGGTTRFEAAARAEKFGGRKIGFTIFLDGREGTQKTQQTDRRS